MDVYTSGVIVGIGRSISVGLLILSLGCAAPKEWTGDWTGNRNITPPAGKDPRWAEEIGRVKLRLHANGRFEVVDGTLPGEGTFSIDGDKATLTIKSVAGREQPEPWIASVRKRADGTLLYSNPNGPVAGDVVLTRETQPGT